MGMHHYFLSEEVGGWFFFDLPFMHVKQERFMAKFMYRNFNAVFVGAKHLPNLV